MEELTLLILGAGWTSTFLLPLLDAHNISFAATTTSGRSVEGHPTLPFKFDPSAPADETRSAVASLPRARYVLVTFPLTGEGQSPRRPWITRHSPYDKTKPRAVAEDELLALSGCVLNLAGLWGGARDPKNWRNRVAATKEMVKGKKSLHLIHGVDVARAVVALVEGGDETWERSGRGQRWMLTDGFVYDWWALLAGWAEEGEDKEKPIEQVKWVGELMRGGGCQGVAKVYGDAREVL
ncbi:hypothetical protein N0V88_006362 [Collariella sp. IMI 366227]|nr:hypothetical protein N0V88_006362 [Collariella sp. IMI 366227]